MVSSRAPSSPQVTCGINACLRGASQVLLFNSPVTGLLVLAALYVQSVSIATYGVIGLVSATALAWYQQRKRKKEKKKSNPMRARYKTSGKDG
eukprot:3936673-Rhodomonas_salina.1